MADERETALGRWSRLKRAGTQTNPPAPANDPAPEPAADSRQGTEVTAPETDLETSPEDAPSERDQAELPDIADLNAESDFSAFLREGVSEEIRRKALRVVCFRRE